MIERGFMFTCDSCGTKLFGDNSKAPEPWGEYSITDFKHIKADNPSKYKSAYIYLCQECNKNFIESLLAFGGAIE